MQTCRRMKSANDDNIIKLAVIVTPARRLLDRSLASLISRRLRVRGTEACTGCSPLLLRCQLILDHVGQTMVFYRTSLTY